MVQNISVNYYGFDEFQKERFEDTWDTENIKWCALFVAVSVLMIIIVHIVELLKQRAFFSGDAKVLRYTRRHEYKMSKNPTLQ